MKLNVLALFMSSILLSACTMDLAFQDGHEIGSLAPETGSDQILSVDFRAKADNAEISELYVSSDKSQFSFVTSIAGYTDTFAADPYLAGAGFVVVVKNSSSPSSWAAKALWTVSSTAEKVQHFVDLPVGLENCDLFPQKSSINLHCVDSDYKVVSYQISRSDKVTTPLLAKLGYVDDGTYRHEIRRVSSVGSALDFIEVRKVAKADDTDTTLVDLYIYLDDGYKKISISSSDLAAIERASVGGASKRLPSVLMFTSFQSSNQEQNLLALDLASSGLSLTRTFVGTNWFNIQGVMGGALILDDNGTLKAYRAGSGLSNLSFSSDNYLGIAGERIYFHSPWVFGQPQEFKACDVDGLCQTIVSDITGYSILSSVNENQKKIYFVNNNVAEASRVIESVDVITQGLVVENDLVASLAAQSIPVSKVNGVEREGKYLVVYFENPDTGKSSYAIFDADSGAFLDSFVRFCSGSPEEQAEYVLKNHKYLASMVPGLNLLERAFGCM
ncbi:hypothetical protein ACNQKP_09720 [Bdellovibrio bacteriovorus]|uniref:hypothetical protein n=1 Tax=Bdellovibrio bacteriovorus TaxID=959 RepID=UPI003AA8582D